MPDIEQIKLKTIGGISKKEVYPITTWDAVLNKPDRFVNIDIYRAIRKLTDYTYEIYCDFLDYEYALQYFSTNDIANTGYCSSVRKGNFYGRNYDWIYNNDVDFVVYTPNRVGRYSTIGIGGTVSGLTQEFIDSKQYSDAYRIVPFGIVDGINEKGVVVNTNVVPAQKGHTTGTIPLIETKYTMCSTMLPRFILDTFDTAQKAVTYIKNYVSVFVRSKLYEDHAYDVHIMVADENSTYLIEFVNNNTVVADISSKAFITNFYLNGVTFNGDGGVYTPYDKSLDNTHDAVTANHITTHGAGLERYNLINTSYSSITGESDMIELLQKLKYTNTYKDTTNPRWYTEGVGVYDDVDVKVNSPLNICEAVYAEMKNRYTSRSRETGLTWHTVHSAVYNIGARSVKVVFQEKNQQFEFLLNVGNGGDLSQYYTKAETNSLLNTKQDTISDLTEIREGASLGETSVQPSDISDMATMTWVNSKGYLTSQTQANWNEQNISSPAYIRNKPSIPSIEGLATKQYVDTEVAKKQNIISDLTSIRSGAAKGNTAVQHEELDDYYTKDETDSAISEHHDSTKQDTISDLTSIRSNATAGKSAKDTIGAYGNIVTHNVNEFATASQGSKADSALQPSALNPYRTSSAQDTIDAGKQNIIEDLDEIREGAALGATALQSQEQPDWDETDTSSPAYIQNKPSIPEGAVIYHNLGQNTDGAIDQKVVTDALNGKQSTISDLSTIRNNADDGKTAKDTIDTYGNIVTHNTSEFATSSQGIKADSALQPTDIVDNLGDTPADKPISARAVNVDMVNYIDGSISDTLSYVDQQDASEHAGRVAGDNLLSGRISTIEDKESGWDAKADLSDIPNVIDNVTSTSTEDALSAKQGKILNDRINNVATRGRFLSLWNCVTGMPVTNPSGYPYTYQTGDFFIVNQTGTTNYIPNGSSYTGQPSTTVYSGSIKINDTIFYDGTSWSVFDTPAGSGDVQDVYQNGESVLSSGIAYVTTPTKTSDLTNDSGYQTATQVQQTVNAHHDDTKVDKVTGKQLSTNDYTTTEKNKLAGIAAGAEVNVQSDWNQSTTTADDYIKNKPTLATVATTGDYNDLSNTPQFSKIKIITASYNDTYTEVRNLSNTYNEICQYLDDGNVVFLFVYYTNTYFYNTFLLQSADNPDPLVFTKLYIDEHFGMSPFGYGIYNEIIKISYNNSIIYTRIEKPFRIWVSTNNTSSLTTSSAEYIDTVADINNPKILNLHKISKTGSYNDLLNKPTIPTQLSQLTDDSTHRLVTDTEKSNIASNTSARHTHSNKSVLDGITSTLVTAWNNAVTWITTNGANILSHLADTVKHITSSERSAWNSKQDELVSGTNIKTINNQSLLGSGNIDIQGSTSTQWGSITGTLSNQTDLNTALSAKYEKPSGGIPNSDLAGGITSGKLASNAVTTAKINNKAVTSAKLADAVNASLAKADNSIQEPATEGTNGQVLTTDGHGVRTWTTVSGGGGGSEMTDFQIVRIDYPYSDIEIGNVEGKRQYLYTSVDLGGNLHFIIYGKKENYMLIYASYEDLTLTVTADNSDLDSIEVIQPAEITCPAGKYIELSIVLVTMYGEDYAVVTVSEPLG